MSSNLRVCTVDQDAVLVIRQQVLWPDKPVQFSRLEQDSNGIHFGAMFYDQLVGVISAFSVHDAIQFRKLAVLHAYQRQGVGRALIERVKQHARTIGASMIYCDSRATASAFYKRQGFTEEGAPFVKSGIPFVRMSFQTNEKHSHTTAKR
jgi:GNAT superfamily N-acetyltransferase